MKSDKIGYWGPALKVIHETAGYAGLAPKPLRPAPAQQQDTSAIHSTSILKLTPVLRPAQG